jgi:hypothetical protein
MGKPVYSRLLKERFVDRGLHQRIPSGTEVFYINRQSPDLWLQSMTSKATTTYLAGKQEAALLNKSNFC